MAKIELSKEITDAGIRLAKPLNGPIQAIQGKDVDVRTLSVSKAKSIAAIEGSFLEFAKEKTPAPAKEVPPKTQTSEGSKK
jgi:hypothetical protein